MKVFFGVRCLEGLHYAGGTDTIMILHFCMLSNDHEIITMYFGSVFLPSVSVESKHVYILYAGSSGMELYIALHLIANEIGPMNSL